MPSCRFFSVSSSMWKRISSLSSRSAAPGRSRARARARTALRKLIWLRRLQDEFHRLHVAAPVVGLDADGAAAGRRELVVLGAPVVFGRVPFALDPPFLLEALERRIERALVHVEHAA